MNNCKPKATPLEGKPTITGSEAITDPTSYRSLVGALQYLTLTRPDIAYNVNFVSQFMQAPTEGHMKLVHRILRYDYADVDWAGCPLTRHSTTGYCTFLGQNIISWCAKKQHTVSRSSTEAEYRALANTAAELTWLTYLLQDFSIPQKVSPTIFCDNLSALYLTVNPVFHARSKHIELDYHYVRERVALGLLVTKYIPTEQQVADIFTKPVPKALIKTFITKLCLQPRLSLRGDINDHRSNKDDYCGQYDLLQKNMEK
ncbi:hypothetical protein K2173_014289 [Erythroxylum novogranatense]|uniref:Uncharacterized protein n=1 Tax=Erythroxylum novogranatense TaxID=1862640 RepID=A0AAV8SEB1_9ROSI|nr:hypothetical protein K2173_014289 [Erythroxylum novogranatense]